MQDSENKTENRIVGLLFYIIVITTAIMVAPLVYELAENYSFNGRASAAGVNLASGEKNAKNKNYTVQENTIDISELKNTEFGTLTPISAKVSNSGELVLFCSYRAEIINASQNGQPEEPKQYETRLQIAAIKNLAESDGSDGHFNAKGDVEVYGRALSARYDLLESVQSGDYIFTDFDDGTFFMSNAKTAFLFDVENMKMAANYAYPPNYAVYHSALSPNKEMLALAAEEGFFIENLNGADAAAEINNFDLKELISATVNANGVKITVRYPFWSSDGSRIFYKLYADENVKNAGVTTTSPGGNEQLATLECGDFLFMDDDLIFYYFSSTSGANPTSFRCGHFNVNERKMNDVMRSQVYYFDVDISPNGTLLAALSHNGNLVKISVIEIRTKKLIYSCLYSEIYDFSFSPDGKNVAIYGRESGRNTLKTLNMDWTEE
ncbi:MAG: hypothetical protein FWG34_08545 [Oscillospiraceae bacterium]|nr:hypothetical protein [Oscillospiraceae bacterium]